MAISDTVIRIKRGGNAPAVPITFANVDLTGSVIEMVLTPANGGQAITITTEDAGLELAPPNGIIWSYTEALAAVLPEGRRTYVDFWRVLGDQREAIGAGTVTVLKSGEVGSGDVQIEVPGIQGPKGDKGDQGDTGPVGATGATGAKGDKGDKGDTGNTGATGAPGTNGTNGTNGADGASVTVTLVESANWPPAADPNPLHIYVRVG